jgi:predicted dehydrogenase
MPVKVALIGLKGHWYGFVEELPSLPECRLVAAADDTSEVLNRLADLPGADADTHAYRDWRELLTKEQPDLVIEAGEDGARAEILLACAERGIDFICEKPLAKTLGELDQVRAAVVRAGVQASMMITMRTQPNYLAMRDAVAQGLIGEITQIGGQKSYRLGERPEWVKHRGTFSGIIPYVGIHIMDLARWVSGHEFVEVMAYASNVSHPEVGDMEDNGCVLAKLDNGASAAFRLDYCRPAAAPTHGDDRLRLAGHLGVIETIAEQVTLITHEAGPRELPQPTAIPFLADFLAARAAKRPPFIPFAECVRITDVVLRAHESAQTGRPIEIPN